MFRTTVLLLLAALALEVCHFSFHIHHLCPIEEGLAEGHHTHESVPVVQSKLNAPHHCDAAVYLRSRFQASESQMRIATTELAHLKPIVARPVFYLEKQIWTYAPKTSPPFFLA